MTSFKITDFKDYKNIISQYSDDFIKNNMCVKISENENEVNICSTKEISSLSSFHFPKKIKFIIVSEMDFAEFIGNFVENTESEKYISSTNIELFSLEKINSDAPVVNIINAICLEALRKGASDIHIQPLSDIVKIRFRLDGVLKTVKTLNKSVFQNLVSRIKVMSQLNIMENRLPQDGRMSVLLDNRRIDFRVSIIPVCYGQSIVMRLFDYGEKSLKLDELGFSSESYELLKKAVDLAFGMILVTGPTGSGKTTTLHALIGEMDVEHKKIMTIEDPVERIIDGVEQIQVNEEIGLTFDSILRRILRQDPDVILIGEIRDKETAQLAVRAALTGHLILSTLHTNDSISSVTRLMNLGIEPYLISSVLKYSLAQRLVRKICKNCGGVSCIECNGTGYKGRTVISEIFSVDEKLSRIIYTGDENKLHFALSERKFIKMRDDARIKVSKGITTLEEIKREVVL